MGHRCHTTDNVSSNIFIFLFIWVLTSLSTHCIGHITGWLVVWAEQTSTYSWSGFCTVNCRPMASNYQLSHLRSGRESSSDFRGGRRECYHSATVPPPPPPPPPQAIFLNVSYCEKLEKTPLTVNIHKFCVLSMCRSYSHLLFIYVLQLLYIFWYIRQSPYMLRLKCKF